jgi:hypothetical protein
VLDRNHAYDCYQVVGNEHVFLRRFANWKEVKLLKGVNLDLFRQCILQAQSRAFGFFWTYAPDDTEAVGNQKTIDEINEIVSTLSCSALYWAACLCSCSLEVMIYVVTCILIMICRP